MAVARRTASASSPITLRELNRAVLARQRLLRRARLDPVTAIERLAGLQAQWSLSPYIALWSRLERFAIADLERALGERRVVKATLMRGTLHLVSAREYPFYVTATSQARVDAWRTAAEAAKLDAPKLREIALSYAGKTPRTKQEIRERLAHLAGKDARRHDALVWAVVNAHGHLVHAPPSGMWRSYREGKLVAARTWVGTFADPPAEEAMRALVRRYLGAFGPASLADLASWSGERRAGRLGPAIASLATELRTFTDERGRTLYDLRRAPRPGADISAPVRYLPRWDSLLLAYAPPERERVLPERYRKAVIRVNGDVLQTFLVDGMVAGSWAVRRRGKEAVLELTPFGRLSRPDRAALVEEGERLVRLVEPDAARHGVRA